MTSYTNAGGKGDRTASITVTTSSGLFAVGAASKLVNGVFDSPGVACQFTSGVTAGWIKFDFGSPAKVIDRFIFWQLGSASHGMWQWFGSDDDATYTPLGTPFDLRGGSGFGGGGAAVEYAQPAGNVAGFRYYKLVQQSGATNAYNAMEFEFSIADFVEPSSSESEPLSEPPASEPASEPDAPVVTSYANPGGTGDRRDIVWVSQGVEQDFVQTPVMQKLVDGSFTTSDLHSLSFTNSQTVAYVIFDFGPTGFKQVIDEFKWIQSSAITQGTWKFAGSDDATTWHDLVTGINLGGSATTTVTVPNSEDYRFYGLFQTGGTTHISPWIEEIEFKLGPRARILDLMPAYITGDRRSVITVSTTAAFSGTLSDILNGTTGAGTFKLTGGQSAKELLFDFGAPVNINEVKWYTDHINSHGTWQWQGSNDGVTYSNLGFPMVLIGPGTGDAEFPAWTYANFDGNPNAYKFYKWKQVAGTTSGTPTIYEIEFRQTESFIDPFPSESESDSEPPPSDSEPPASEPPSDSEPPASEPPSDSEPPASEPPPESEPPEGSTPPIQMCIIAI